MSIYNMIECIFAGQFAGGIRLLRADGRAPLPSGTGRTMAAAGIMDADKGNFFHFFPPINGQRLPIHWLFCMEGNPFLYPVFFAI